MNTKSNFIQLILSLTIGFVLTIFFLGYENIGLTKTNWFIKYDTISDFLALKFFLNDKWHFPLGLNSNYGDLLLSLNRHKKGLEHIKIGSGFINFTQENFEII